MSDVRKLAAKYSPRAEVICEIEIDSGTFEQGLEQSTSPAIFSARVAFAANHAEEKATPARRRRKIQTLIAETAPRLNYGAT
jgi:hypothetical protein